MNAIIRISSGLRLERVVPPRVISRSGRGGGLRHGGTVLLLLLAFGAVQGILLLALALALVLLALVLLATVHGPVR